MQIDASSEMATLEKNNKLKKRLNSIKEKEKLKSMTEEPAPIISNHKMLQKPRQNDVPDMPKRPPCIEWLRNAMSILLNVLVIPVGKSENKRQRLKKKLAQSNDIMGFLTLDMGKHALKLPREVGALLTYASLVLETKFEPEHIEDMVNDAKQADPIVNN